MRGHVAIIMKPSQHYVLTESTISGRDIVLIPGLLPIFLHSCEIKSGSSLGTRLTVMISKAKISRPSDILDLKIASEIMYLSASNWKKIFWGSMPPDSLVPRLLFTNRENSVVNYLYHFGSNILKSQ